VEEALQNLSLASLQNHEFIVGLAVAAILVAAMVGSSLFRNIALALAAGAIVLLYVQGGVAALIAAFGMIEKEVRSLPEFANGLVVGLVIASVLAFGFRHRSA